MSPDGRPSGGSLIKKWLKFRRFCVAPRLGIPFTFKCCVIAMSPSQLKMAITGACLLVMLVGALLMVQFMNDGAGSAGMTLGAMLILIPASVMMTRLPRLWKYQSMNRDWYHTTYPDRVQGNQLACRACGSDHIHTRQLSPFTGYLGHICGRCDTTLFYS